MNEPQAMDSGKNLLRIMRGNFLWGFSLALIFGFLITLFLPASTFASINVGSGIPIQGTVGYGVLTEPANSNSSLVLLDSTPFRLTEDWEVRGESLDYEIHSNLRTHETESGLDIGFENSEVFLKYRTLLTVDNSSQLSYYANFTGLTGSVEAGISMYFWTPTVGVEEVLIQKAQRNIDSGESSTLKLDIDFSNVHTNLEIRSVVFVISLRSSNSATATIQDVSITKTSSILQSPLTIELQSLKGDSVFDAPLSPSFVRIQITDNDNPSYSGYLYPTRKNDTVFLNPGNYNIQIIPYFEYIDGSEPLNCSLMLSEDERSIVRFRLPFLRLYLGIQPDVPYIAVILHYEDSWYYMMFEYLHDMVTNYVYIPYQSARLSISVYIPGYSTDSSTHQISSFSTEIEMDTPMDLFLDVRFPYFSFVGLTFSPGEMIIGIFATSILFAVLTRNTQIRKLNFDKIKQSIRIHWAGLCIVASLVLPWFTRSNVVAVSSTSGNTVYRTVIGPGVFYIDSLNLGKAIVVGNNMLLLVMVLLIGMVIYRDQQRYGWSIGQRYGLLLGTMVTVILGFTLILSNYWRVEVGVIFLIATSIVRFVEVVIYPRVSHLLMK
jgi:hypothetical protein